jgi:hypothetical protein
MNWRELMTEPEGKTPKSNILKTLKTPFMETESRGFEDIENAIRVSLSLEPPETYRPVRMAPNVRRQMAVDSEALFLHLWRRLANRFNRVMEPGYLLHVQSHEPELWAWREALRTAWDDPQVWSAFKACGIPWTKYRRLIYSWARVELACIGRHRD